MNKIKILHIGELPRELGGRYTTGVGNVVVELAKAQTNNVNIDVAVYARNTNSKKAGFVKQFKTFGFSKNIFIYFFSIVLHPFMTIRELFYYKSVLNENPIRHYCHRVNIQKVINEYNPDIIQVHGLMEFTPVNIANRKGIRTILTYHGVFDEILDSRLFDDSIRYVKYVTALTEDEVLKLKPFYKNVEAMTIIPNGTDTSKFYFSLNEGSNIRNQLGFNMTDIVFITVASIQPRKGQLAFIKYLQHSGLINYRYLIIGNGNQYDEIKDYIDKNNLNKNVYLIGYVNNKDLYKYYSASDVYAHVSSEEGQSLSELEADATGIKVLVNNSLVQTLPCDISCNERFFVINLDKYSNDFKKWCCNKTQNRHSINSYSWRNIESKYFEFYKKIMS